MKSSGPRGAMPLAADGAPEEQEADSRERRGDYRNAQADDPRDRQDHAHHRHHTEAASRHHQPVGALLPRPAGHPGRRSLEIAHALNLVSPAAPVPENVPGMTELRGERVVLRP